MANIDRKHDVILLMDNYSKEGEQLHTSFKLQGKDYPVVVLEDDGFIPRDVISLYGYFLGDFQNAKNGLGHPRYFNQVKVPLLWEISGTNAVGSVHDKSVERARIFYAEPKHKRQVKIVDWLDERGVVRSSDHYNRYGALYARTTFNAKGQKVNKSYFDVDGKEIIVENYVTKDIILNDGETVRFFQGKEEFAVFLLEKLNFMDARFFINSLSTPFFISQGRSGRMEKDVLFWQEGKRDDIPGNMQLILDGKSNTGEIVVQKRKAYDKLIELGASEKMVRCKGYMYPFERQNSHRKEALICTNSDNIESLHQIVEGLPEMHFHIAAITEMSSKLMKAGSFSNVTLYPNIKMKELDSLFEKCDYYFDINHESEIVSAVYRAFLNNQWIVAFANTIHNVDYIAEEHIYENLDVQSLIKDVKVAMERENVLDNHILLQKMAALAEE